MTRTAEVVVIGAGITGLSIALHLAESGLSPLIIERSGVAAGASGVQPGGVRQQWSTRLSCELAREGAAFYRDLPARLETPLPVHFEPCGYLFIAHSQARLDELAAGVALQNEVGVPSRVLTADEARQVAPELQTSDLVGASWCEEDGYFDHPQTVVEAFSVAARERGARIEIGEVVSIRPVGTDWQLTLRDGSSCTAAQVVIAAGCDSPGLARQFDIELPIEPVARHLFLSAPIAERLLEPLVVSAERHFAAKQLADGRLLASDLSATGDPVEGRPLWLGRVRSAIDELLPRLSFASFATFVSGLYDVTPDNHPILGTVDGHAGLHLAAGFSGHGFMLAPAVGRRIADSVLGAPPDDALLQTSHTRFARGSLHHELATV
jgi:sarcosine oxidase subunit beta